jgi:hypothetical protein
VAVFVGSLLLIVVAVGLLVIGLLQGANSMLVASIAASLLAAIALIVGGRQKAAAGSGSRATTRVREREEEMADVRRSRRAADRQPVGVGAGGAAPEPMADETSVMAPVRDEEPYPPSIPQQHDVRDEDDYDADYDDDEEDPEDEPPAQQTLPADAARVASMSTEVFVIDGRPRYHLRGCVHMLGRDSEPLPVSEAVELGFTPCSMCEPDSSLLAAARRV